ncbi:AMP-dependent synthetase [Rubrivirga sp. SAORIC476]|uniref:acyl-CoA synthetase n=1 Tax=Rubrivirga sp. SAORIC476 TaxID=1961794 RepID=UPI000BA9407B|nr:long-chain fatty acid--CoA ligase [Rubrivirga sp. SAORIC476]PAP81003.1 AMP-dependent synthetase [Rubrivirga sp. SAORIC476]
MTDAIRTDWLARQALYHGARPAVVWEPTGESLSFADLDRLGSALARALQERFGVDPGDRVAILAENSLEHVLLFVACQKSGAILVPLNYRLTGPELAYLVEDSDPTVVFVADACTLASDVQQVPLADVRPLAEGDATFAPQAPVTHDNPLMLLYTSGTTGRPKGAIYTHGMLVWNAVNSIHRLSLTPGDVSFNAAPFYHTGGWNVLLTPFFLAGGTTILLDRFDADALLRLCDARGITILWGVPTMLQMMAESPAFEDASLASVRYAIVGGEPMPAPLTRTWQAKGVPVRQGFGMTEVGVNCFSLPEADAVRKMGSIGFPNLFVDIRILDADGQEVATGETGELVFRGPVVTPGYWRNPEATAAAFTPDGWFRSGDLVRQDDEGYVYVVGRLKEMYISGGENVYPAEVEAVLREHPAVTEAAVIGVPDARWGEAGLAFVVVGAPLAPEALLAFCRERLAGYKVPRAVRFLDALPVGHSGKIQKTALTALVSDS